MGAWDRLWWRPGFKKSQGKKKTACKPKSAFGRFPRTRLVAPFAIEKYIQIASAMRGPLEAAPHHMLCLILCQAASRYSTPISRGAIANEIITVHG